MKRILWTLILLYSVFFINSCSFYHELKDKKEQDALKNQLLTLLDLQSKVQSLTDSMKSMELLQLFASGGGLPDECTPPPDADPDWVIPEQCASFIPEDCPDAETWEDLQACGGYEEGLTATLPPECQYADASETIPDNCKQYIDERCRESSVTWADAQLCLTDLTGNLPDTSQDPNPIDDYPGQTPVAGQTQKGTCFFDTDSAITESRDWCCFNTTPTECLAVWDFYDSGSDKTFTPVFNDNPSSSADSCYSQGFVYCNQDIQCCYN
jgi:hypothetical protein